MPLSLSCQEFAAAWPGLDPGEPLPPGMASHLASCPRCRARAASDPSRLFSVLRGGIPEPAPAWEPLWQSALARAAERARARRLRRAWASATAAALLVAAALWLLRPDLRDERQPLGGQRVAQELHGVQPAGSLQSAAAAPAPPTLESIVSPAARVVDFKIFGERDQVTEVILIFDEGIEL